MQTSPFTPIKLKVVSLKKGIVESVKNLQNTSKIAAKYLFLNGFENRLINLKQFIINKSGPNNKYI